MRFDQNFASVNENVSVPTPKANGRIDLITSAPTLNITAYQRTDVNNENFYKEATYGQLSVTPLGRLFFSEENIEALHQGIRYRVYVETDKQYVIGRQSDAELKIVMRSTFLQYARHDPSNIVEQVRELNARVLAWIVPEVMSNLLQYQNYIRDASTLPIPLEHAELSTQKGTKILEQKSFM